MVLVAHLSDLHLDGGERNAERAARMVSYVDGLRSPVDAMLVTGDVADHGRAEEYRQAREILTARCPVFSCPGNHDVRAAYRQVLLGGQAAEEPVNHAHHAGGALFVLCDTSVPGQDGGFLADDTLGWLERVLADNPAGTPAFLCLHHPPVTLHSPFIDPIRQRGERRLAALLDGRPEVVAILCGHAHTAAASTFAGRPLLVAPGVATGLRLPWEHGDVLDADLPPGVAFHVLDEGWRITTHYRLLP